MQCAPEVSRLSRWLVIAAGVLVTGVGLAGVMGWAYPDFPLPGRGSAIGPPRPETAAALVIAGPALLLFIRSPGVMRRGLGQFLGALAGLIGLLGILDQLRVDATGLLPIRHLLGDPAMEAPPPTSAASTALLLCGIALATIDAADRPWLTWPQGYALGAASIALVTVLAYIFEAARPSAGPVSLVAMPPVTAVSIMALAGSVFLIRPGRGVLRLFGSLGPGGTLVRRLTPTLALIPVGIAMLAAIVVGVGGGSPALALALSTALFLVITVLVLGYTIKALDESATRRDKVLNELLQAEESLASRASELEQANERLRMGNRQLSEAAEFKRDLMSLVSHEVSQPLSSVASLAELLHSDWADLPDDLRQDLSSKIDKNARRLTRMINDMMLLFRLDAGTVSARRESVPVVEVVDAVAESLPDTAQIITSVDPDLYVLVDRGHLLQVLTNLVANAMAHGEPPIEINAVQTTDGVVVSVCDHGEGIVEEHLPHLFDRVTPRRPGGGRRTRGSGLGLFIVRHLVEVNGGTIWYERMEPRGAKLSVRLPPGTIRTDGSRPEPTMPGPEEAHDSTTPEASDARQPQTA